METETDPAMSKSVSVKDFNLLSPKQEVKRLRLGLYALGLRFYGSRGTRAWLFQDAPVVRTG